MTRKSDPVVVTGFSSGDTCDKGVDHFVDLEDIFVPDWVAWLHRQAKYGFANKYTKTQAGFQITPKDVEICPDLSEIAYVLIGYGRRS